MYPNPQDVLPLPPRPHLEHYRRRARELVEACNDGEEAIDTWAADWVAKLFELVEAPLAQGEADPSARRVAGFARDCLARAGCALSQAQFVIARAHGFASWPKLLRHIEGLSSPESDLSAFERAADAIVAGELDSLERLLAFNAGLARARSDRDHNATLLHYVAANGVENFRQKTPANILAIARRLLDAGAEVDAEANVYGGGCTTLGLVVTSAYMQQAGAQIALADLLIERGAQLPAGIVHACLMNGCPEAAAHMAALGAPVTLPDASGLGLLTTVARYFEPPPTVSPDDATAALLMASWYGHLDVVAFLLDRGVNVGVRHPTDGKTALHVAAYRGNSRLVDLLLKQGAPVNVNDAVYETPPLVWALHAWLIERHADEDGYRTVVRMLAGAGAEVKPEWIDNDRLRADPDLYSVLSARSTKA